MGKDAIATRNGLPWIMAVYFPHDAQTYATIKAKAVPGQISVLYRSIRPAVEQAGPNLEAATKANAKIQAGLLASSSPVIAEAIKNNQLKVVSAYYELATGAVSLLA